MDVSFPALLQVGQRGYYAVRQLLLAGHDAANVSGGWKSFQEFRAAHQLQGGHDAAKL